MNIKQTSFQSVLTLFESTKCPFQKSMNESTDKIVLHSKTQKLLMLIYKFYKISCLLSLIFYISKVSVVEIGSDKMLIVMFVSIKRVSKIVAFDL